MSNHYLLYPIISPWHICLLLHVLFLAIIYVIIALRSLVVNPTNDEIIVVTTIEQSVSIKNLSISGLSNKQMAIGVITDKSTVTHSLKTVFLINVRIDKPRSRLASIKLRLIASSSNKRETIKTDVGLHPKRRQIYAHGKINNLLPYTLISNIFISPVAFIATSKGFLSVEINDVITINCTKITVYSGTMLSQSLNIVSASNRIGIKGIRINKKESRALRNIKVSISMMSPAA